MFYILLKCNDTKRWKEKVVDNKVATNKRINTCNLQENNML